MKHNVDYKFSDDIKSVQDFCDALERNYAIRLIEKRSIDDQFDCYLLIIFQNDNKLKVQYELYDLYDCLKLATSRVDMLYNLSEGGYLVVDR